MAESGPRKLKRSAWTRETEQGLLVLWQDHPCLYDVSSLHYHDRIEKERAWREIANCLQQPLEEVKTRAASLRTQYSRLIKPKASGSDNKPLTPRQKWLLRVMHFIKQYIVHRQCEKTVDMSFSDQDDTEDLEDPSDPLEESQSPLSRPESPTPVAAMSRSTSPCEWTDVGALPPVAKKVKHKKRPDDDVELQKLMFLKQMAAKVDGDPADAYTTFGNQVASELRLIKDQANLTRLKRNIINMIYDTQDSERSTSTSSSQVLSTLPSPPPSI